MNTIKRVGGIAIALLLAILIASPSITRAQLVQGIVVNFVETQDNEQGTALNVKVYFTFLNADRKVIPSIDVNGAEVKIPDLGIVQKAKVDKAEGGIGMVLVLDTSGSMAEEMFQMKQAAKELVDKSPNATRFTVIRFSTDVETILTFTEDKDRVKSVIDGLRPSGETCLFDAMAKAVESLIGTVAGRRAVVVFTDGRDTKRDGKTPCSVNTRETVIEKATANNFVVPIYAIGLSQQRDQIDVESLTEIASKTNGIAAIGSNLKLLFGEIIDVINSQYVAEFEITPPEGSFGADITIQLQGGLTTPPGAFTLLSAKDFTPPATQIPPTGTPLPVTVSAEPPVLSPDGKTLLIEPKSSDPARTKEFRVIVVDSNGTQVSSQTLPSPLQGKVSIAIGSIASGQYKIVISAVGTDGTVSQTIEQQVNVLQTPTPTIPPPPTDVPPTGTPEPVVISVEPPVLSPDGKSLLIEPKTNDAGRTKEFRVIVVDANGTQVSTQTIPAPLQGKISIPIGTIPAGTYKIVITAVSSNGAVSQVVEQQVNVVQTPTPTTPPTQTAEPVSARIDSIVYKDEITKQVVILRMVYQGVLQIANVRVTLFDTSGTVSTGKEIVVPPSPNIDFDIAGIRGGKYKFRVQALNANGEAIMQMPLVEFDHTLSPTATPTFTPSATPVVVEIKANVRLAADNSGFVFPIEVKNGSTVKRYRLQIFDEANTQQGEFFFDPPTSNELTVDIANFARTGKYRVVIVALGEKDAILSETNVQFSYSPPTMTPTLTLTPRSFMTDLVEAYRTPSSQPIAFLVTGAVVIALAGLIFALVRRPKKQAAPNILAERTDAIDLSKMGLPPPGASKPASLPPPVAPGLLPRGGDADKTSPVPMAGFDSDKTGAMLAGNGLAMPTAQLRVESSRDTAVNGRTLTIDKSPFVMGRKDKDINFDNDDNVSRRHAEITWVNGAYFLTDTGSTHHTYLNDRELPPNVPQALASGATIRLGSTTILRFIQTGGFDASKTSFS